MDLPHRQRLIFRLLHNLPFSRPFVIDAAKVEDAVDDDPVQFAFVVVIGELFRIGAYGIKADEEVTVETVSFAIVEGNDICIIIMLQILAVHFEYLLVRAEDVGDFTDSFSVSGGYGFYSFRGFTLLDGWHFHAVCLITNHFIYDLMIYDVRLKLRSCD